MARVRSHTEVGSRVRMYYAGACTRARTLIGYGATVMRRLIRKWSGQLCDGVNNNPVPPVHAVVDAPCKSAFDQRVSALAARNPTATRRARSSRDHRPKSLANYDHRLVLRLTRSYANRTFPTFHRKLIDKRRDSTCAKASILIVLDSIFIQSREEDYLRFYCCSLKK